MGKKTFKRAVSLVIALMMILSGTQVFFAETGLPYDEDDIILYKTATPVEGKDDTYKIQLSVKGKDIDTGKKVDVILVIDNSASMFTSEYNNKTLGKITEEAAKVFVDGVLNEANDESGNVRVAVVKYGEHAKAHIFSSSDSWSDNWSSGLNLTGKEVYTSDKDAAYDAIEKATEPTIDEGTNTEGGFLMAKKVAEVKRDDAVNLVIFMTDGLPTYRYNNNGIAVNDSSGNQTSGDELNEAIEAAQALKTHISQEGEIYTIALLNNVSNTSNQAKLASNLLSLSPKKYIDGTWPINNNNIMPYVDYPGRWSGTDAYAKVYYPIHAGDEADEMMEDIYETLAGAINALANGTVTDVIHENFQLTGDSITYLESKDVDIAENEDGTTTLVFNDISAWGKKFDLPAFEVEVRPGVYGTGYTNKEADYTFTLFGEDDPITKHFDKPVVAIKPTAANDDDYEVFQGQELTVSIDDGVLVNDESVKIDDGEYSVDYLVVEDGYVGIEIDTYEGGKVVVAADGTFVYTPPSSEFTGFDTFKYKNKAKVTYDGTGDDEFGLAGNHISNEAIVTIYVIPVEGDLIPYTVKHQVQESNEVLYLREGSGVEGQIIKESKKDFEGYVLAPDESDEKQMTLEANGFNTIVFWYVADSEEPVEPDGNFITVKHYTKTGSASKVLVRTDTPIPVTTSTTIYGEDYKVSSLEVNRYKFQSSTPESWDVVTDVTTEGAIEYIFELLYYRDSTSPGPGPGPGPSPDPKPVEIPDQEIPVAELEKEDHFAYVIGYPEGDVRPLNNITREEVAMIFYRLLTDDSRNQLLSDVNPFTDMDQYHAWSNRAVSTLYNAGIISGYPDGTFRPSDPITRAEFATIAAKFDDLDLGSASAFTDIFGHWAEKYITSSENKGWIKGYPDMTFKPEQDITRAEAMTLINNVLERGVPAENIHPDSIFWPDNPEAEWYYEAVMEATNSHNYVYEEDGDELWTGMKPNKVWP